MRPDDDQQRPYTIEKISQERIKDVSNCRRFTLAIITDTLWSSCASTFMFTLAHKSPFIDILVYTESEHCLFVVWCIVVLFLRALETNVPLSQFFPWYPGLQLQ